MGALLNLHRFFVSYTTRIYGLNHMKTAHIQDVGYRCYDNYTMQI